MKNRYQPVITGLGIVAPIGIGASAFWESAAAGKSGIGWLTQYDASGLPRPCQIAGEVRDFVSRDWMGGIAGRMAGRFSQFAVATCRMAVVEAGLHEAAIPPERIKVSIGSSMSGAVHIQEPTFSAFLHGEKVVPWTVLEYSVHAATSHVGAEVGALGHPTSFATACCAGLDAVAWAADQIGRGDAAAVIAGATETPLSPYVLTAFHSSGTLSMWEGAPEEASRPFERRRSGLVLAEGAATVVVEDYINARARGAPIYARILGFGSCSEGGELRTVDESGEAGGRAMAMAIRDASLSPGDIDYICAHGNSMINYDVAETAAIKLALGRQAGNVPVSSIKSMCGHALGAAGAMQVVTVCLAMKHGTVPPTINYEERDPRCDLDYVPNVARRIRIKHALIHGHSIGGTHMALVLGTPD
jgi:3-oxoacyl-[acyl-carrier-protein] synthase II